MFDTLFWVECCMHGLLDSWKLEVEGLNCRMGRRVKVKAFTFCVKQFWYDLLNNITVAAIFMLFFVSILFYVFKALGY